MDPLYDQHGTVTAWLDRATGDIVDLDGKPRAFIENDSVYDYRSGTHLGWWETDHIRDGRGAIGGFLQGSTAMGVQKPSLGFPPYAPYKAFPPFKPFKAFKPFKPFFISAWSEKNLF